MANGLPRHFAEFLLATSLVCAACGGGGGDVQPDEVLSVEVVSGDNQAGRVNQILADPIVVLVTSDGNAAPGVTVNWSAPAPGDEFNPASSTTDANGMASASWVLGAVAGAHTAQAAVSGAIGSPVTLNATALEPLPTPATIDVTVRNNSFLSVRNSTSNPAVDTVAVGGTVTWTWAPTATSPHDVTSTGSPGFTGQPTLVQPPPFSVTFSAAGTYDYYCTQHGQPASGMRGRIVVR